MYIPKFNEETDVSVLHSLIKENPFGAWTTVSKGELTINHIPFVLNENKGEYGTLLGHVAKKNPIWESFSKDIESAIAFQVHDSYISPSWYPTKHEHGKAVPTWNYTVVYAWGIPKVIEDREWLLTHVEEITSIHERDQKLPWKVSDAPDEYIDRLLGFIVGIEIPITKLKGKFKLGQNRSEADKLGTIVGLVSKNTDKSKGLASLLNKHIEESK
ncbi:MAG: FMN-binding negative transcriptional regulator [Candidatus Thiodiazotropha sp.]